MSLQIFIALEHPLKGNKSASALIGAGLLWTNYAMTRTDPHLVKENLIESVAATAQIVFFLMGANERINRLWLLPFNGKKPAKYFART